VSLDDARQRARDALAAGDVLEEIGLPEFGGRLRVLARDVLELAEQLEAERSARRTIQADRDDAVAILARQADAALAAATNASARTTRTVGVDAAA